jgi:hypothetical protein
MEPSITELSYKEIKHDVTSIHDILPQSIVRGYDIKFTLHTTKFALSGTCKLLMAPLTKEEIQEKLITALKDDLQQAAQDIKGLF